MGTNENSPNKTKAPKTPGEVISEMISIRARLLPALAYINEPGIIPIIVPKK